MTLRLRLLVLADRILASLIGAVLVGTTLAFGGAVWWARPAIAVAALLLVLAHLAKVALLGRWTVLKSPLGGLGALAVALAAAQLVPLPGRVADRIAPRARAAHALGVLPDRAHADDPEATLPADVLGRSPATVNRSATLRWLVGGLACLVLFGVSAHFADRLRHALVIWGGVVAALFLVTTSGLVQMLGGTEGLYGIVAPGQGVVWAPSTADLLATPNTTVLRSARDAERGELNWAVRRPDRPGAIGGLMGGPGAYLALGSLGLPLALGLTLQLLAPRGSRERLGPRLRHAGRGPLAALMVALTLASAALTGTVSGPILAVPFALGLVLAGLPSARGTGLRWIAVGTTALALAALVAGVLMGEAGVRPAGSDPLVEGTASGWAEARARWGETVQIARDFPGLGAGLGSFATLHPYYKTADEASTTASSSLLQWWAEAGAVGLALAGLAALWCLARLPGAIRRVGTADRALAFGLVGAGSCFAIVSALHWTVELPAVALAAGAVAGTADRWLAGGTDLFVEPA